MAENGGTVGSDAREKARQVAQDVQERMEGMRGYAEDAGEWIRTLARERPIAALALAVGVGFVFGRLLSRT
jgi:ElaB/YqjD/DUF883 family membrane-anchored ribosome-binding protein